jgi:hypothetical protein
MSPGSPTDRRTCAKLVREQLDAVDPGSYDDFGRFRDTVANDLKAGGSRTGTVLI